jgi:uncharacterized protein YndB with AHSA1/START domain
MLMTATDIRKEFSRAAHEEEDGMAIEPTGRRETRGFGEAVVFDRSFPTGADDIWALFTDPELLQRWIGTWAGDPASGSVVFRMTAEGADAPEETVWIDECDAPRTLRIRIGALESPDQHWAYEIGLVETDGATTLTFATSARGVYPVSDTAPGWEYYLDRLVAAQSGSDPSGIDFARDYYPAMSEHYRAMFA